VAVASAGPYASLHLAPDRYHASTPPLSFLQAGCPSCCPTNSVKALKADHPEKKHTPLELNLQEHRKALLQKILLLRDLVIHVKARMLKSKPQNQGQGQSQGRTLTRSRPMTKKLVLTPRPRINMRGELWQR